MAGNDTMIGQENGNDVNGLEIQRGNGHSPLRAATPLSRSGNFVVLNKSTLSQMKTVHHIPAGKMQKMIFPSHENGDANPATAAATTTTTSTTTTVSKHMQPITLNNSAALPSSLSSSKLPLSASPPSQQQQQQQPPLARPLSVDPSVRLAHFESFKRLVPNQNHTKTITNNITISTNGRPKSPPKSGILIKRNHLKNFTMRKLNVVRSAKANDDAKADADVDVDRDADAKINNNSSNNNRMIRRTVQFSINNNSKDNKNHRSLKTLIADLEN